MNDWGTLILFDAVAIVKAGRFPQVWGASAGDQLLALIREGNDHLVGATAAQHFFREGRWCPGDSLSHPAAVACLDDQSGGMLLRSFTDARSPTVSSFTPPAARRASSSVQSSTGLRWPGPPGGVSMGALASVDNQHIGPQANRFLLTARPKRPASDPRKSLFGWLEEIPCHCHSWSSRSGRGRRHS